MPKAIGLLRTCLVGMALTASMMAECKCYPPNVTATLIRPGEQPVDMGSWLMQNGPLGNCHLLPGDSVRFDLSFDCPSDVWATRDDALVVDTIYYEFGVSLTFGADGVYTLYSIGTDAVDQTAMFTLDHNYLTTRPWSVGIFVFLAGALDTLTGMMRTDLQAQGLLPLQEPYTALGYMLTEGGGSVTTSSVLTGSTEQLAITDWVVVELREPEDPAIVVASKCALLTRYGRVLDPDGTSFEITAAAGDYLVAIRHRNHLGIMSSAQLQFIGFHRWMNFTVMSATAWGTDALIVLGNKKAMCAGNSVDGEHRRLSYVGALNDRDPILQRIGGSAPHNTVIGYFNEDYNLDGIVKYTGANNDRDMLLQNIGGYMPTAVRWEQLP